MKEQLRKTLVRLLLPLGLSLLLLVVLLCGLSQAIEAGPRVTSATTARERKGPSLLDYQTGVSVCQQTENLVPNPGFEQGNGEPWEPDHWREVGDCFFSYDDPGPDSDVSARIFAGSSRDEYCRLRTTPIDKILVEPGRCYDYSGLVQADLIQGDAYLRIVFWSWQEDPWHIEGNAYTTPVTDTQGVWVEVTGSAQAPADAEYAMVEVVLPKSSLGSVWFDDIFFGLATCLDISKSDDPDPVEPGQMLTYIIVYSNTGREKATNVQIIETYDDYVRFQWADPSPYPGVQNLWRISELLPGDSGTITIVVQVEDDTGERAWLFNKVTILSEETGAMTDPVHYIEPTAIITDGCAIYLDPTRAEKSGEPGHQTDYRLTLGNASSCDGLADLVVISPQGWDVIITPPPPYTLSPGELKDMTVSLFVAEHVFSGTVRVATITATLECESPCNGTATATGTFTTTVGLGGDVVLAPDRTGSAPPGGQVVYTHILTNGTNVTQTATLTAGSSQGYVVTVEPTTTGSLAPWDGSATVTVTVHVAGDALVGTADATVVTATGAMAGQDTVTDITTVEWYKVYLPLILREWSPFWEHEPNVSCLQANGPLISGADYYGYHDDEWDCFSIDVCTTGQITADLTGTGEGVCLLLYYQSSENLVERDCTPPYHIEYTGPAGRYYICIYTESGHNTDTPYTLRATFP